MTQCGQTWKASLERGRRAAEALERLDLPPEPSMKRYIHPIPCCCPPPYPSWDEGQLDSVLEALARQNQLLLDLLGAVNALNAAVLSIQSRL